MYRVLYLVLAAVGLAEFSSTLPLHPGPNLTFLPAPVKFLPEIFSVLCAVYVVIAGISRHFHLVSIKYWIAFGLFTIIIVCGALANTEAPGPILGELRYFLRPIPFFFLPAVLDFKEWQKDRILKFVLGLSFLQVPISIYQRYYCELRGWSTGDGVTGTMIDSGCMTLVLICVICVLAAAMLRGRITKWSFVWMFVLLLIPISIDETKVTLFLFPPALLGTFLAASPPERKLRVFLTGLAIIVIGGSIFIPTYNYFNQLNVSKDEQFTVSDVLSKDFLSNYLSHDASVGSGKEVGRADAVSVPVKTLANDPIKFAFGLGLGNASYSLLGPSFIGQYFYTLGPYVIGFDSGTFLLETGIFGFILILTIHWMIFRDSLVVARADLGITGVIAAGWVGTSLVILVGIFYSGIHANSAVSYLYWFFSGFVTAQRVALSRPQLRNSGRAVRNGDISVAGAARVALSSRINQR